MLDPSGTRAYILYGSTNLSERDINALGVVEYGMVLSMHTVIQMCSRGLSIGSCV